MAFRCFGLSPIVRRPCDGRNEATLHWLRGEDEILDGDTFAALVHQSNIAKTSRRVTTVINRG